MDTVGHSLIIVCLAHHCPSVSSLLISKDAPVQESLFELHITYLLLNVISGMIDMHLWLTPLLLYFMEHTPPTLNIMETPFITLAPVSIAPIYCMGPYKISWLF